jgi:hypothetical protein
MRAWTVACCRLLVEEDDNELIASFQLDPAGGGDGTMRKFVGAWRVRPHPADPQHACIATLDQVGGGRWSLGKQGAELLMRSYPGAAGAVCTLQHRNALPP